MCFSFWGNVFVWRIFYGVENLETSIVGFFKIVKYITLEYCIKIYVYNMMGLV